MIKYVLATLLFFPTLSFCGESVVYEIYVSSFTDIKLKETKDEIKLKTKNLNQPIQIINIVELSTSSIIIIADKVIEDLTSIKLCVLEGKIKKIGSYFYDKNGYDRKHPDFIKLKNYFNSKYKVEISTL